MAQSPAPASSVATMRMIIGASALAVAMLLVGWALADGRFRDAEGYWDSPICLPLGCAVAGLVLAIGGLWRRGQCLAAAFWFALALIGQSVTLQLIEAGTNVSFQHYRTLGECFSGPFRWHVAFVFLQTLLVAVAMRHQMARMFRRAIAGIGAWRLVIIGLFVLASSATKINIRPLVFIQEMAWATYVQLLGLATVVAGCCFIPESILSSLRGFFDRLLTSSDASDAFAPRIDRFAMGCALWVTIIATLLGVFVYERHPHVPDEVVYLQHARYFANGQLTMSPPAVPEAFDVDLLEMNSDHWYSPVPVGWPLFLAVGAFLGSPWMVNPILGGLIVLGGYWILTDLYGRRRARIAALLMCASPWLLFMSMNVMTHNAALASAVFATIGVIKARHSGQAVWAWLGGGALGMVALIRPVEGLCTAVLLGLWSIGVGGKRLRTSAVIGLVLGSMAVAAIVLPYNKHLTGKATYFPIMAYVDAHYGPGKNSLGFGPEKGLGWRGVDPFPGHGPLDAVINNNLNAFSVNVELLGWSCGSVLLIALAVFGGRLSRSDRLMLAVIAMIVGIHVFYWYSGGPDFGARYWYLIFIPCIALVVRGAELISTKLADVRGAPQANVRILMGMAVMMLAGLLIYVPWRSVDRYHHFRGMRPDVRRIIAENNLGRCLVLVRGASRSDDYAAAFCYNPLDYESDAPIFAWDRVDKPEVREAVVRHYADRPIWILEGTSITHGPFRLAAGPLTAEQVLSEIQGGRDG